MEAKKKTIITIVSVVVAAVLSVAVMGIALAFYTLRVTNSYTISFAAEGGVACDIEAQYRLANITETAAGSYTTVKTSGDEKSIMEFAGNETDTTTGVYKKSFKDLGIQEIKFDQYFVLRYKIANNKTASKDLTMEFIVTQNGTPTNMTVSYAYTKNSTDISTNLTTNRSNFKSTFAEAFNNATIAKGETAYIYMIFEITNTNTTAEFSGENSWVLSVA